MCSSGGKSMRQLMLNAAVVKQTYGLNIDADLAAVSTMPRNRSCIASSSMSRLLPHFPAYWQVVTTGALAYVAILVPPQVAFADVQVLSLVWWLGSFVDTENHHWGTDAPRGAAKYVRTWFVLDLVSIFPFDFFLFRFHPEGVSSVRLVKLIRLMRLLKLGRIFRIPHLWHRLEITMDIDYLQLKLCKYIALFVIFTHWLACLLFMLASYSELLSADPAEQDTWVDDFCNRWGVLSGPREKYIASVYFAAAIITRLGVGDIVPASTADAPLFVSVMMQVVVPIACCGFYAYVIGCVFALLSAMHAENETFITELDNLNQFMRYRNLPPQLRVKLRDFVHFRWRERRLKGSDMNELALTPSLSSSVYYFTHIPLLKSLHPFRGVTDDFLTTLCERMSMCMFSSQDMIIRPGRPVPAMHILERGIVMKAARVLKPHAVLGMEMLVSEFPTWRGIICLTNVMTLSISREVYLSLVREFPGIAHALRQNAIRDKVREGVIAYTDLVRRALPTLLNDGGDMLKFERTAIPGQLQMLYDIRLNILLADPSTGGPLRSAVKMLQRIRRYHRTRHLVLADLERRAGYQPLVWVMEQAMQKHGIEHLLPKFLEHEHDAWTLSQCQPKDLERVYRVPVRTAAAFLDDILRSTATRGLVKPTCRASHRAVAVHVSTAVSLFLEIANRKRHERLKATGELMRQLDHARSIYKWARRTCGRAQTKSCHAGGVA